VPAPFLVKEEIALIGPMELAVPVLELLTTKALLPPTTPLAAVMTLPVKVAALVRVMPAP